MPTTLDRWLDDPQALAVRLPAGPARRFLDARRLIVPGGCSALLDDPEQLLPAGSQRDKLPALTLVKDGLFAVDHSADGLLDREGHAHQASVTLSLYVDAAEVAPVRRFRGAFLNDSGGEGACDTAAITARLAPAIDAALTSFTARHGAEQLMSETVDEALENDLRRSLRPELEDLGLALSRVRRALFRSPQLEAMRARRAERELAEAAEAERQAELRAQAETEALARQLQLEKVERELARQRELDEQRVSLEAAREQRQMAVAHELQSKELAHRLELAKQAAAELSGADLKALVAQLEDPTARERLYGLLIQQQMTPEQLAALSQEKQANEVSALREQLAALSERLESGSGGYARLDAPLDAPPTARILVACGEHVLAFDPATNLDYTRPRERYTAGAPLAADLGGMRSVRLDESGQQLLIGARSGVHVHDLQTGAAVAHPIGRAAQGRTAVNAVARLGDHLLATHSEFGLLAWPLEDASAETDAPLLGARDVARETTVTASAVRGLIAGEGQVFYAADNRVYGLGPSLEGPRLYTGPSEPVSALVLLGKELFASTVGGAIYSWPVGDPHSPRRVHARRAKIYSLRALGSRALLVGSKDRGVLRLDLDDRGGPPREQTYQAGSLVRWAAGAGDFVAGVDHDGRQLILWRTDSPDIEWRRIPIGEPINDVVFLPRA